MESRARENLKNTKINLLGCGKNRQHPLLFLFVLKFKEYKA